MSNTAATYQEHELVQMLKSRDDSAFSYLYDHYSAALNAVISGIITSQEQACDVLQEVFVKIWKQIDSYDSSKGRLFTWMMNIARNASIDVVRSKSFQQSKQNRELKENVYDSVETTQLNIDKIGIRKIVHKLKEDHRVLVELSYFEGFTQDEIAKMLKIPLGTVKTRLRAALIQLKQVIKN